MKKKYSQEKKFLALIFVPVLLGVFFVLKPFINIFALAGIAIVATLPIYKFFLKKTSPLIASVLSSLLLLLVFIIPIFFLIKTISWQLTDLSKEIDVFIHTLELNKIIESVNEQATKFFGFNPNLQTEQLRALVINQARTIGVSSGKTFLTIVGSLFQTLTDTLIFFVLYASGLTNVEKLINFFKVLVPVEQEIKEEFSKNVVFVVNNLLLSTFLISLVQGVLAFILFYLVGTPAPLFLAILAFFLAFIPLVGNSLIMYLVGVLHLLAGYQTEGAIILLVQFILIGNTDLILRPLLNFNNTNLHSALLILSIIGGLSAFGFFGFIYGPVIMTVFVTFLRVFHKEYTQK